MPEAVHDIELPGCTPEPLMAYLKALGILRLVSEQKGENARGWWNNDVFWLRSPALFEGKDTDEKRRDALSGFLLEEYRPAPLVAPWNAGSGFYSKYDETKQAFKGREAGEALSAIECSSAPRFEPYRNQIGAIKNALKERAKRVDPAQQIANLRDRGKSEGWSKKKTNAEVKRWLDSQMFFAADGSTLAIEKVDKDEFVRDVRSSLVNDEAIRWIDAAFVIHTGQKKNRDEAPLLGSGGNIGNSDFSARFVQILTSCLSLRVANGPTDESAALLRGALFGAPTRGLASLAVDQFDPGRAGGANMHHGMEAGFRLNPWDYILMLEGALLLQSASSKRLRAVASGSAFPFAVASTPAGFTSSGTDTTRGEQWFPIWHRACSASEIGALLAEGRSDVGPKQARTGVDMARAAASLGVDRGIRQFVRVQYQARFGDNYIANALGRVDTVPRESADLLRQIDWWLDDFRWKCAAGRKKEEAPKRILVTLNRIDSAIFEFCRYGGPRLFQNVMVALGCAERELTVTQGKFRKQVVKPIPMLRREWIAAANDNSPEFTVALALASVNDPEAKIGQIRTNLEAVDWKKRYPAWAEKDRSVVWNAADLPTSLASILQRRMMDGERAGCERLPLASRFDAPLDAVAAFIEGDIDDGRIEDLLWGLMLVDPRQRSGEKAIEPAELTDQPQLPRDYSLLKLLFLPRPLVQERVGDKVRWRLARRLDNGRLESGITIRPEPRILPLLRAGRVGEACRVAAHRLRVSGLPPMPGSLPTGVIRDGDWSECSSDYRRAQRLAAALLIPISSSSVSNLLRLVCRDSLAAAEMLTFSEELET